jgi:rod shape-determining protein MreC
MKLERRSLSRLALPLKAMADRFAFAALVAISIALLILGKANLSLFTTINTRVSDALIPIMAALSQPIEASRHLVQAVGEMAAIYEENARLRQQNQRLIEWQNVARSLALENQALRGALNMEHAAERPTLVAGRVVADAGGPFVHTVLVDVGRKHGVVVGMAAVNDQGLAGRVIEVGGRSARLLLLTDFNSKVPVMVEPSRDQAVLSGDNSREPGLIFMPLNPRVSIGDRVVTSGRGGVLPPGLAVGVVSSIGEDKVAVRSWVDWDRLEYLRLVEYAAVVPPEQLEELQKERYGPPPPAAMPERPADPAQARRADVAEPPGRPAASTALPWVPGDVRPERP